MKSRLVPATSLLLVLPLAAQCGFQSLGGLTGPGPGVGLDSCAVFDDGSGAALYVSGAFTAAGGVPAQNVARWNGQSWSALGSGFGGVPAGFPAASGMLVHDDGSGPALYTSGTFQTAGGVAASLVARWTAAGWSALGTGLSGATNPIQPASVRWLEEFDDGSGTTLYAGGQFTNAGGLVVNSMARWNGTSWSGVAGGVSAPFGFESVDGMAVFDDGTGPALYVGGLFDNAGGVAVNNVARWNGLAWSAVGLGLSGNNGVGSLRVWDDGNGPALYATGSFTNSGATTLNGVARWNGSAWMPLGTGIGGGGNPDFGADLWGFVDGGGPGLYVGGSFATAGGVTVNNLARWDGSSWSAVANGTGSGAGPLPGVSAFATFDDGTGSALFVGGAFATVSGIPTAGVARFACNNLRAHLSQPAGPGTGLRVSNAGLTAGREYYTLFSAEPCLAGVGSGPWLGLCTVDVQTLVLQLALPLGVGPVHFQAAGPYAAWGPFAVPPVTLEAVCFDATGGFISAFSNVTRFTLR